MDLDGMTVTRIEFVECDELDAAGYDIIGQPGPQHVAFRRIRRMRIGYRFMGMLQMKPDLIGDDEGQWDLPSDLLISQFTESDGRPALLPHAAVLDFERRMMGKHVICAPHIACEDLVISYDDDDPEHQELSLLIELTVEFLA